MAQLICENLTLGYEGNIVVKDLNFTVNEGDYLCIVGHNGSGKTTLMKTLLGLLKPIGGKIERGESLKSTGIGYLPQQTLTQRDFPASVWEVVISGCQARRGFRPFYSKEDKLLAEKNIKKMELEPLKKRCYRELSGGQQQRVLLARALCATDGMLLLDEPVSGLDPIVTKEMYEAIKQLNEEGTTVIMISHDIASALTYASHVLYVSDESFFGTKEEFERSEYFKNLVCARREEA